MNQQSYDSLSVLLSSRGIIMSAVVDLLCLLFSQSRSCKDSPPLDSFRIGEIIITFLDEDINIFRYVTPSVFQRITYTAIPDKCRQKHISLIKYVPHFDCAPYFNMVVIKVSVVIDEGQQPKRWC